MMDDICIDELCTGIIGIKITDLYLVSLDTPIYLYDGSFCVLKLFYCWTGGVVVVVVVNYFGSNILIGVETKMVSAQCKKCNADSHAEITFRQTDK